VAGWLKKLLGTERTQVPSEQIERHSATGCYQEPKSAKLLKQVTKLKKGGKLEEAIETLKKAYHEIEREGGSHAMQTYLRLPMLLQQAGRPDAAWEEYNRLLRSDPTGMGQSREVTPMFHSQIYDKMRLFLQREGKTKSAVEFGLMSAASWATGLYYQKRMSELESMLENENLERVVVPLLRKAKIPDIAPILVGILRASLRQVPKLDMHGMVDEVQRAIQES